MSDYASLCFLSYNRPNFLSQAIATATANAGEPVEVIVHDDGSIDDGLLDYLTRMQRGGLISKLILSPPGHNEGQGKALNAMFNIASGDPIIKLDQDLIFEPGWLVKVNDILSDQRVGLLGLFKYEHHPVDWRQTGIDDMPGGVVSAPVGYSFHTHICGSGFALPRRVWEELGPFEEHSDAFAEDADMQARVHKSRDWYNALPDEDLVVNQGFGPGPSTVVFHDTEVDGGIGVAKINHGPKVFQPEGLTVGGYGSHEGRANFGALEGRR